jgi:hypothetical protein
LIGLVTLTIFDEQRTMRNDIVICKRTARILCQMATAKLGSKASAPVAFSGIQTLPGIPPD